MSFYDYMMCYLEDDSYISDLARDMEMDNRIDECETDVNKLYEYFKSMIDKEYILKVVSESLEAYSKGKWI